MRGFSRRDFVAAVAASLSLAKPRWAYGGSSDSRALRFAHTHTGERLSVEYFNQGTYLQDALVAINQNADVAVRTTATVSYPLNFTTPGVYRLYVRGKYTGGGDNSFFVPPHKADGTSPINGDPANATDNGNPFDNHNADTARANNYNWFGSDSGDVPVLRGGDEPQAEPPR